MLESISFFCPAYRDEDNLPRLIASAHAFLPRITLRYEILIIHDGSPDRTGQVADDLARRYPFVRVIHHARNEGYGAALHDGFRAARYAYVMYTDGDAQYDITEFAPYLHLLEKADIITGYARKKAVSYMRRMQSMIYGFFIGALFGVWIRDINCSMKIYKKAVIDTLPIKSTSAFIDAEMLISAQRRGISIAQFPVTHYRRSAGVASGSRPSVVLATIRDAVSFRFGLL